MSTTPSTDRTEIPTPPPGKSITRWAKSTIRTIQHLNKVLAGI